MDQTNDYTTGNLLDYEYFSKHYKLFAIDLSKQIELENSDLEQKNNFIGKLEENNAKKFFITEKSGNVIDSRTAKGKYSQNNYIKFET